MVIITKKQTKPRAEDDFYPTPLKLAEAIVQRFVTEIPTYSLDPGCGNGVFGYALRSALKRDREMLIDGIDLKRRAWMFKDLDPYNSFLCDDFLNCRSWFLRDRYDLVIGNPPYDQAEPFIRKSIDFVGDRGKVIFLLKLAFLESKKRARGLFKEMPPTEVSVLAGRPSFDGTGKTNDYAFAVFIWDMWRRKMHPLEAPTVSWFDWN